MHDSDISLKKTWAGVAVAFVLWFIMFSPITGPRLNFWYAMTTSAVVLTSYTFWASPKWREQLHLGVGQVALGIVLAAVLWGVFWVGDKLSQLMFSFARSEVDLIYSMKAGSNPTVIGILLLFIIGPAEEIFWRGFVQRTMSQRWSPTVGMVVATACYTLVHVSSLNFMLIMAAMVAGGFWGLLYRIWPKNLTALIISHALWDAAAFVFIPF